LNAVIGATRGERKKRDRREKNGCPDFEPAAEIDGLPDLPVYRFN
jgi:hypothetical protein